MSTVIYDSTINTVQSFQILQHDKKYNKVYFYVINTKAWVSIESNFALWTLC
jgi:hypothetical protein